MRMHEMDEWLMRRGFSVLRDHSPITGRYRFKVWKGDHYMVKEFIYPDNVSPVGVDEIQRRFLEDLALEFYSNMDVASYYPLNPCYGMTSYNKLPQIEKVVFNGPATIVFWSDHTKTVVKAQDGEVCDREKGLAMAISKKALGNKGNYYKTFDKWLKENEEE